MENAEVNALLKIIGLQYRLKYDKDEDVKTLRYGKIMVMADQVCYVELHEFLQKLLLSKKIFYSSKIAFAVRFFLDLMLRKP